MKLGVTQLLVYFILLVLVWLPSNLSSQELNKNIQESNFAKITSPLSNLIQMAIVDGQIELVKNWELQLRRQNTDKTNEELAEQEIQKQIDRGIPEEIARRMAERGNRMGMEKSGIGLAFQEIHQVFGPGSRGSGGNANNRQWRFSNAQMSGELKKSTERISLRLTDENAGIQLEIMEVDQDRLTFRLTHNDGILDFNQKNGRVRLAIIQGETASVAVAENYDELLEKHADDLNEKLFPIWDSLGLQKPLSFSSPVVAAAAIEKLESIERDAMEVVVHLEALSGDSLKARDEAEAALRQSYYKWAELIETHREEIKFDERAAKRLEKIEQASPATPYQDYVNSQDFNDPNTLIQLLKHVPEDKRAFLKEKIESLGEEIPRDSIPDKNNSGSH